MNYYVNREGKELGPYSLAELQRNLSQGNIRPTDLARSDGLDQWVPVQQVAGNIEVAQPPAPPVNYGQVPVYAQASGGVAVETAETPAGPIPPGLHWLWVLVLTAATFYIFGMIWMFVEAAYAHKLRTKSIPLIFYGIGIPATFFAGIMTAIPDLRPFAGLAQIIGSVLIIAGHFSIKNALEEYYNSVEPIHLELSGGMTFFFNVVYIQYHLSKIRRWRLTGVGIHE
jgi:hypothetical protein